MIQLGWRAYHADGRTFASNEWLWSAIPSFDIPGVVEFLEPPYRRIHDGYDWIWLLDGEFYSVTNHPEWGEWAKRPESIDPSILKRGVGMEDDAWKLMQRRMFEDRTWP